MHQNDLPEERKVSDWSSTLQVCILKVEKSKKKQHESENDSEYQQLFTEETRTWCWESSDRAHQDFL